MSTTEVQNNSNTFRSFLSLHVHTCYTAERPRSQLSLASRTPLHIPQPNQTPQTQSQTAYARASRLIDNRDQNDRPVHAQSTFRLFRYPPPTTPASHSILGKTDYNS